MQYVSFVLSGILFYAISRRTNFQNYQKFAFLIFGRYLFAGLMTMACTFIGIHADWKKEMFDEDERKYHVSEEKDKLPSFTSPAGCMINAITCGFQTNIFLLQVITSLKDPEKYTTDKISARHYQSKNFSYKTLIFLSVGYFMTFFFLLYPYEGKMNIVKPITA